jgi:hypothetical protein
MNHDVFISYSRADAPVADDICKALDEAGISYWIDRGSITSGDAFHEMIVKAIRECKVTVFVSSVNSNMSEYTIKEIVIAFKSKKHIIPFCLDENPYADKIEFYLCDLDQLQYYLHKEFAIQKLVDDLNRLLGKKDPQPALSYILKIRPNRTCMLFVDDEPRAEIPAGKITRLPLNRGAFRLEFVSTENEKDRYVIPEYILADPEQLLAVDLESMAQARDEREKLAKYALLLKEEKYKEAYELIVSLAEKGIAEAQVGLGDMYLNGFGVSRDDAEAAKWYRKAAEQGHAEGQYKLGYMHDFGWGVSNDDAEAVKWYRKAAEQGHAEGQYYLGYHYQY